MIHTLQISPSTKSPPFPCENGHFQRWFCIKPFPDIMQFDMTGDIDAVEGFGSIQCDEEYIRARERDDAVCCCGWGG